MNNSKRYCYKLNDVLISFSGKSNIMPYLLREDIKKLYQDFLAGKVTKFERLNEN
jgi:hypothetical protein